MSRNLFHGTTRVPGKSHAPNLPRGPQRWKTSFEQNAFMIMSTGHVDKETAEWLNRKGLEVAQFSQFHTEPPTAATRFADEYVVCTPYGWFFWVPDDPENDPEFHHWSAPLQMVAAFARANGYDYVMLDCDGPVVDGLPVYRW